MHSQAQVAAFLVERHIHTSQAWLQSAYTHATTLNSAEPLTSTLSRLWLQTDITVSLAQDAPCFPPLPDDPERSGSVTLRAPTMVQIIEIHEIGTSVAGQLEALDALREKQKPIERRLVRLEDEGDAEPAATAPVNPGEVSSIAKKTLRLVLQDACGQRRMAIEQKPIPLLDILQTLIGAKILLDAGVVVVQGVVLLKPLTTRLLGGASSQAASDNIVARMNALEALLKEQRNLLPRAEMPPANQAGQQALNTTGAGATRGRGGGRGRARGRGATRGRGQS